MPDPDLQQRFSDLVDEHHVALRAFVRALGVAPDWVDDVAQETFLKAYRELASFDDSRPFGPWLRGIARNIVRNELRASARRHRILHERVADIMLAVVDNDADPFESLGDSADVTDALRDCLAELSEKGRQLIKMRYADDLPASRIAESVGSNPPAVRQALVRSRGALRDCITRKMNGGPS